MKIKRKQIFILSVCFVIFLSLHNTVFAEDAAGRSTDEKLQYGDFTYCLDGNNAKITGYSGSAANLSVPETINGYKVTSIEYEAFRECSSLKTVRLPESIRNIGSMAFAQCNNLEQIILPEGLETIGGYFIEYTAIQSLTIPSTVTDCGFCISDADHLEEIIFADGMEKVPDRACAFTDSYGNRNNETLKRIIVPDSVREIGKEAFYKCVAIEKLQLGKQIEKIDGEAFYGCTWIKSIRVPENITFMGSGVFEKCSNLETVILPEGLREIGNFSFSGTKVKRLTVPSTVESCGGLLDGSQIEEIVFADGMKVIPMAVCNRNMIDNSVLKKVVIPDSVIKIDRSAFADCTSIEEFVSSENLEVIGEEAFKGCIWLTNADNLIKNVKDIRESAFEGCSNLESMILPEGLEHLGRYFVKGTKIQSLKIPKTIKESDSGVVLGADRLQEVIFEDGTETIPYGICGDYQEKNNALKRVVMPDSVTEIEGNAFENCTAIEEFDISKNLKKIGNGAFKGCIWMTEFEVPDQVVSINDYAFAGCSNLKSLTLPEGLEYIGYNIIYGTKLNTLTIPKTINQSGSYTWDTGGNTDGVIAGASSLKTVIFEDGMKEIPDYFCANRKDNQSLKAVVIPASVSKIGKSSFSRCQSVTIYGDKGSYAEIYAKEKNIPFKTKEELEDPSGITATVSFENNEKTKELHWTENGYSEQEIKLNITIDSVPEYVKLTRLTVELKNLKMFQVKESSKVTNNLNDYTYIVHTDQSVNQGESVTFQLTLVKKGLTWWKPNDTEVHSGIIDISAYGINQNGEGLESKSAWISQLSVKYQNDVRIKKKTDDEEKAALEAEQTSKDAADTAVRKFTDLSDKMILDPNIETYLGHDQYEALKMLIYTEISLANMSKETFASAGLSDQVAEQIMKKFLGYEKPIFGIADKNVPICVVVAGKNNQQYQFEFECNIKCFLLNGLAFGINGNIKTQMWKVSKPNRKIQQIPCADGIINQGDIQSFSKAVWSVAESSLKSAYKEVWGNDADKIANGIMESSIDSLASKAAKYGIEKPVQILLKQYYEEKLKGKFSESFFKILTYPSKMLVVQCPVDIYVYDAENNLKGSIVEDEVTIKDTGIAMWTEGDDKYIQLFNEDYYILYKATGTGTMKINLYDQMLNNYNYRNCEFASIALKEGKEYTQQISENFMEDAADYTIHTSEGETFEVTSEKDLYEDKYPEHVHVWDAGKITEEATCLKKGRKVYVCTICGATKEEVLAKIKPFIKVNVTSIPLKVGQSTDKVKVTQLAKGDFIKSWKSSDKKTVTVNSKGKITAKKQTGKAVITITSASGLKKKIKVTVQKKAVAAQKITGIKKSLTLKTGKKITLKPVVTPITFAGRIAYHSSDKKVITVSRKGKLTAKKKGKAVVTVKCGKKKMKCRIKVK